VKRGPLLAIAFWVVAFVAVDAWAGRFRWKMRERAGATGERLERQYRVPNPYYHHDLAPDHATDSAMWGPIAYPLRTNSLGFRDSAVRTVPARGTRPRILLIGDSFTEGLGVPFDSTAAGFLARKLDTAGVDVLNAAVLSYSPAIYWKKVQFLVEAGIAIDAVVVLLDVSDVQDEALRYRVDSVSGHVIDAPEEHATFWESWAHNSIALRAASKALRLIRPHAPYGGCFAPDVLQDVDCRAGWTLSPAVMRRYGEAGLALADSNMTKLAALLRARRIPLTVVVYPWPQQLQWADRASRQESYWRSWSAREGAAFISLFQPLFAQVDARGLDATIAENFIAGDVHWSAAGHRLVAAQLAAMLALPKMQHTP